MEVAAASTVGGGGCIMCTRSHLKGFDLLAEVDGSHAAIEGLQAGDLWVLHECLWVFDAGPTTGGMANKSRYEAGHLLCCSAAGFLGRAAHSSSPLKVNILAM